MADERMNVVQLEGWTWPGIAMVGQDALSTACTLEWIADMLAGNFKMVHPDDVARTKEACVMELRRLADELGKCRKGA